MIKARPIKCYQCKQAAQNVPVLIGSKQSLCLNCVLMKSSTKYLLTRHLITPIVYKSTSQKKFQIYRCRLAPMLPDTSAIGFCVIGKKFDIIPQYWPVKSLKIEINGETFWAKQTNSYYVNDNFLKNEGERYIDISLQIEDIAETQCVLACFQLKQMSLPELIKASISDLLSRSQPIVFKQYESSAEGKNFDMRCPFTWNNIKIPIRFIQCKHFQCVDYSNLGRVQIDLNGVFECPYCKTKTNLSSLIVDPIQYKIIESELPEIESMQEINQGLNTYIFYESPSNYTIGKRPS